jgi:hypothetical protein
LTSKNDTFTHMVHGIYEVLLLKHQTHEQTRPNHLSDFFRRPNNCIFECSVGHNGERERERERERGREREREREEGDGEGE